MYSEHAQPYLEQGILEVPVKLNRACREDIVQTTLGCSLHEDTQVGCVTASSHKTGQVLMTDISHGLHFKSQGSVDRNGVLVNHLDGDLNTVPFALVPYHIPEGLKPCGKCTCTCTYINKTWVIPCQINTKNGRPLSDFHETWSAGSTSLLISSNQKLALEVVWLLFYSPPKTGYFMYFCYT